MYYPKSQIVPNLYTNGEEYVYAVNSKEYIGHYFATADGKFFTGKNPNNKPNQRLTPLSSTPENNDPTIQSEYIPEDYYVINDYYYYAKGINIFNMGAPPPLPKSSFPTPTQKDYEAGEIQRYFIKKYNEMLYIEIDKEDYPKYAKRTQEVNSSLYLPFKLPWVITGNRKKAFKVNQASVNRIERSNSIQGFKSYFKGRFDQLFKYSKNENLYTEGKEYRLPSNGQFYKGYYHIHPQKGAMEGRQHTNTSHNILIPVSGSNTQFIVNKTETQVINKSSGY